MTPTTEWLTDTPTIAEQGNGLLAHPAAVSTIGVTPTMLTFVVLAGIILGAEVLRVLVLLGSRPQTAAHHTR